MDGAGNRSAHRADYILERGIWRATCRECGWKVADTQRRQAATQFRIHIQDMRSALAAMAEQVTIDLREGVTAVLDGGSLPARLSPWGAQRPPSVHPAAIRGEARGQTGAQG